MQLKLSTSARIFYRAYGPQSLLMCQTGKRLEAGETIQLREPEIRCYDHRDMPAIPIDSSGDKAIFFEWLEEEDKEMVRRTFPDNHLIMRRH